MTLPEFFGLCRHKWKTTNRTSTDYWDPDVSRAFRMMCRSEGRLDLTMDDARKMGYMPNRTDETIRQVCEKCGEERVKRFKNV